jgi:hypothetical protein
MITAADVNRANHGANMRLVNKIGLGLCLTLFCMLATQAVKGDEYNRKTVITFSGPVDVPGIGAQTLPAGTYIFKVLDSPSDRHIVQILNEDESHVYTTILAIPNYRLKSTDKTVITFRERPAGEPEALKAWFYPGHAWGDEFVYDKPKALLLAKETNEVVLSTPVVLSNAPVDSLAAAPIEAVGPSGDTVAMTSVVEPPPASEPQPEQVAYLPKTASYLPLIGLFGLLALCGGFLIMGTVKHSV